MSEPVSIVSWVPRARPKQLPIVLGASILVVGCSSFHGTLTDTTSRVEPSTPQITWNTPSPITYGTPLSGTQLDASSNVAGQFSYSPSAGAILAAGSQTLSVTFTPSDSNDYVTTTAAVVLSVDQATPIVNWSTPLPIDYGVPLGPTQLDAAAQIPGAFTYSPSLGSVLSIGSHSLSAFFTPIDTADYTTSTANVSINVLSPQASSLWQPPQVQSTNGLGLVGIPAPNRQFVPLLRPTIHANSGTLVCTGANWNSSGTTLSISYSLGASVVHVTVTIASNSSGLTANIAADAPLISSVDMGGWDSALNVQSIPVPYYTGNIWYSEPISAYLNAWWNWRSTNATALDGTAAQYHPRTDGTLNPLSEQLVIAASSDVDRVLPASGNAASPYMTTMSGRTVLDIFDWGFATVQQGLADLGDFGISNCVGIIHLWQNQGPDNALPEHYPADPNLGGNSTLQSAMQQGESDGCLMALHENYIDYYPNYPQFDPQAVALNSNGSWMLSWLNQSTGIQSFSAKPGWMVKNASTQSPLIHAAFATTADFIDVLSSTSISRHGDMDASIPGAGTLSAWMNACSSLWNYERKTHNGPVLGEGMDHWYYSGQLDGVEAQLGAGGVSMGSDTSLPLFVDFDLLEVHPLQVNHGMGYYYRWTQDGSSLMSTTQLDAYRMQEIAFGHSPYLGQYIWNDVSRAFVESNLAVPVSERYGTANAISIQYNTDAGWISSSDAVRRGSLSQVAITYDNGLSVVANASPAPLNWNQLVLPQFGWAAKSADFLAYTAQCGSTICDYAQTPASLFANARNQSDWNIGWGYAAPSVNTLQQGSAHDLVFSMAWQVYRSFGDAIPYNVFVQFVNDSQASSSNEGIEFAKNYMPSPVISTWQPGQTYVDGPFTVTIPASVPDGTYSVRVGIYDSMGERLLLAGKNDGTLRYIAGYVTISGSGTQVSFTPVAAPSNDPRLNAAGSIVDFGAVKTDGMISITQEDGNWVLRPFPRSRSFTVLLNGSDFPIPAVIQTNGSSGSQESPIILGAYWQIPLNGSKSYSWAATN